MAQSTPRKTSITARRTYALLKGALFSQLAALPFEQLTLTDICNTALISRSTFYRYFEDKYDLRNRVIAYKAGQLFDNACQELEKNSINSFEEELLFITDYIIDCFCRQHSLMEFVAKNLSWGIFKHTFSSTEFMASQDFYDHYLQSMEKYHIKCKSPELMLFTIIELIGATSYNCILHNQPVSIEEYLPYLHETLRHIIIVYTDETPSA